MRAATGNLQHITSDGREYCTAILHVTINLLVYKIYDIHHVNNTISTDNVHGIFPMGCWHYTEIKEDLCLTDMTEDVVNPYKNGL